jgi:hypothetical protein
MCQAAPNEHRKEPKFGQMIGTEQESTMENNLDFQHSGMNLQVPTQFVRAF